jgi:hypothetical protein
MCSRATKAPAITQRYLVLYADLLSALQMGEVSELKQVAKVRGLSETADLWKEQRLHVLAHLFENMGAQPWEKDITYRSSMEMIDDNICVFHVYLEIVLRNCQGPNNSKRKITLFRMHMEKDGTSKRW